MAAIIVNYIQMQIMFLLKIRTNLHLEFSMQNYSKSGRETEHNYYHHSQV